MNDMQRPLGAVERWYWFCDQFSSLNVVSRVQVRGQLTRDMLRSALDRLQARHPLLRARIQHDNGSNLFWAPCDHPIPLRIASRDRDDQWIEEINERELAKRVDPDTGPLMRVVGILGDDQIHDLLLVMPHILADGTTALSLAEQILAFAAGDDDRIVEYRPLPAPEDMRPLPFKGEEGKSRLARQTEDDQALIEKYRPGRVEPSAFVAFEERKERLIHRELNKVQIDKIAAEAKRHGTTVHGALTAALAVAAHRDAGAPSSHFAIGSPVNFRTELDPPVQPDEVGTYVATIPTVVDVTRPFWEVAKEITDQLAARKTRGDHFNLVNLILQAIPETLAEARPFMEMMEAEGPINLVSSNIGRHPFPDRFSGLEASNAQFVAGLSVLGYFVATINTSHHQTYWNFSHIDTAFPAGRAERLADDCVDTVLSATPELAQATV